jgi:repressor of nif and glnA expression
MKLCNTVENREARGWILNIIDRQKPYGTSPEMIETTLLEIGFNCTLNEIKSHLKYLEEKGYIRLEEIERSGVRRRLNYITPKGIDLKEGNIQPDPGIMQVG